jgi:CheY-like chemotaxis protein
MTRLAFVIDDNRMIAKSLGQMLSLLGYETQAAFGSLMGLQMLNQITPDLILLDLHMQGVNGIEVCRYIRRDARLANVPVIAISSDNQEVMISGVREAGANFFLGKPIEFDALEKVVRQIETAHSAPTQILENRRNVPPQTRPHKS